MGATCVSGNGSYRFFLLFFRNSTSMRNPKKAKLPPMIQKIGSQVPICPPKKTGQLIQNGLAGLHASESLVTRYAPVCLLAITKKPTRKAQLPKSAYSPTGGISSMSPFRESSDESVFNCLANSCQGSFLCCSDFSRLSLNANTKTRSPERMLISVCRSKTSEPVMSPITL
jgi:hypothetical protein